MNDAYRSLVASLRVGPLWMDVFARVDRRKFIPATIWDDSVDPMVKVVRTDDPQRWEELVYRDDAVITQVEDGVATERPWLKSSSSSSPSIVAQMLDRLALAPEHRVLEIGTGTGWNAALLATRIGDDQVISMEVDPAVADHARKALAEAGLTPTVITGDGALGYPQGAPYDRVMSTAAVHRVPVPWIQQTRIGGRIMTPWGTPYDNGALLEMVVQDDGSAVGTFTDDSFAFMYLRAQRPTRAAVEDVVSPYDAYDERTSTLHPWEPVGDRHIRFLIGLRVNDCRTVAVPDEDSYVVYALDPDSHSWASIHVTDDDSNEQVFPVHQFGPRRLWDEIEAAHHWWVDVGRPHANRFGVKAQPDGQQWVFLDNPERIVSVIV